MMKTSNSLAKRAVSFLLTLVMVIGMIPAVTFEAEAAISVPGAGNNHTVGSGSSYGWTYDSTYGAFTRITLIEVAADDDDSMNDSATQVFSSDPKTIMGATKVLGSIDIGASDAPPTFTDSDLVWFDTNAVDYARKVQSAGSEAAATSAVVSYLDSSWKTGWTTATQEGGAPRYLSWNDFAAKYLSSTNSDIDAAASQGSPIPSWLWKFTEPSDIFGCYGDLGSQGDVTITSSRFICAVRHFGMVH